MWVNYINKEVRCKVTICTVAGCELTEYAKGQGINYLEFWAAYTHKPMRGCYLLFVALKLIVLARRAKERMYAPPSPENDTGGSGHIAAEESFDRAAKAIYENLEEADRAAKFQRIEFTVEGGG